MPTMRGLSMTQRFDRYAANARVAAAAPDMLEALERAEKALDDMDKCYATRLSIRDCEVLAAINAAIKKARGEK